MKVKIVALEEHMATPEILTAWSADDTLMRDMTMRWSVGSPTAEALTDLGEGRLEAMDTAGIDVAVLSLTTPGLQAFSAPDAVAFQRDTNDVIADAVGHRPDRFQGFATLATSNPAAAVSELQRAVSQLGLNGVMLHSRSGDQFVDEPQFADIFDVAAHHRAPIYLHPSITVDPVRDSYYRGFGDAVDAMLASGAPGWHYQTGLVLLRLILNGTFDRNPDLQILLGHWGEMVLFYLERIAVLDGMARLDRPLVDYFRQNVLITPSGVQSDRYLRWTAEVVGTDRILQATDWPYARVPAGEARSFIEQAPLSEKDRIAIGSGNWQRIVDGIRR
jgi:predicted TIM-barrel fold metal-dependent hydrolase